MFDILNKINDYEIRNIAKNNGIELYLSNGTKKSKETLASELNDLLPKDKTERYNFLEKIALKGRFIFIPFKLNATINISNVDNIQKFSEHEFLIKPSYDKNPLLSTYYYVLNNKKLCFAIKKFLSGTNMNVQNSYKELQKIANTQISFQSPKMLMRKFLNDLQNQKLSSKVFKIDDFKYRFFYISHRISGEYITLSTTLSAGNRKIEKSLKNIDDYSIEDNTIDTLMISAKLNKLIDSTPEIIEYSIINIPDIILNDLKEVKLNLLIYSKAKNHIRFMLSFKEKEIKIFNIDTTIEDIKNIYKLVERHKWKIKFTTSY